jgi:hypothetical protein
MSTNIITNEMISATVNYLLFDKETDKYPDLRKRLLESDCINSQTLNAEQQAWSLAMTIRAANERAYRGSYPTAHIGNDFGPFEYLDSYGFDNIFQAMKAIDFIIANCGWQDCQLIQVLHETSIFLIGKYFRSRPEYKIVQWD